MLEQSQFDHELAGSPLNNRYLHCRYGLPDDAHPWDVRDPSATPEAECDYFRAVFLELERSGLVQGLTFLVTSSVERVPVTGQDVVVLVLHDEWARRPWFSRQVRTVLKCYGSRPYFPWSTLWPPSALGAAGAANHARIRAAGLLHLARGRAEAGARRLTDNVHAVPLGWYKQVEVPWVDFDDRPYDASFVGSLVHDLALGNVVKRSVKRALGNPKLRSRRELLQAARELESDQPSLQLRLEVSGSFHDVGQDAAQAYSELMMASKISLTPRGTSMETFRFFEALRVGTVPLAEPLPPLWFYEGSPFPVVRSWSALPALIHDVLDDEVRAQALHAASLDWWRSRCAPPVVAERIEEWVRRL